MESVNLDEVLSLDESCEGPDHMYDDDGMDSCTVLPCVGRGVNMINISEIKLPADYYAAIQPPVQSAQASPKPKQTSGKGRAQLIHEDRIKCFRPGGSHTPNGSNSPGGNNIPVGDYRPGGNGIFVEHSLSWHTEAQKGSTSFDEDFPPLSGSVSSDKLSVTSDKPDTGLNSREQPDSLKAIAEGFLAARNIPQNDYKYK